MRDLAAIQRRFYELVTSSAEALDSTPNSVGSAAHPSGAGVTERDLFGSSRRLEVYADMYLNRLCDVLAEDFAKLRAALGHDSFRQLATAYFRAEPPTSFTIRDCGLALSRYLATCGDVPPWSADLAALERAFIEVFDGADSVALSRDALATVPIEHFPEFELRLVPASVLVPLRWTVDALWSSIDDNVARATPVPCKRLVLVWRRDVRVLHRTLDADEAELVALLVRPTSIATLSAKLGELVGEAPEQRMAALLARWLDAELLAA